MKTLSILSEHDKIIIVKSKALNEKTEDLKMTFKEINKRYSATIAAYMANGYYINSSTMGGSQGEIAHVDLTNGKEIIRVLLDSFYTYGENHLEGIAIIVGRCVDKFVKPDAQPKLDTIWNNKLEIISDERFFQVSYANRSGNKFYGTEEEAIAAQDKSFERWAARQTTTEKDLPENAKAIALAWVKKQPKCKSTRLSDIDRVYSDISYSRFNNSCAKRYYVVVKGKTMRI